MRSLNKNSVELSIARVFAALAVGILVATFTGPVSQHFGYQLDPRVDYLLGIVMAAVTWLSLRKVIQVALQTEDTMKIPTARPAPAYLHGGQRKSAVGPVDDGGSTSTACPTKRCPEPEERCSSCSAELKQEPQPDGSVKVTVIVKGLSKKEWNNLRARLEDAKSVPATKWEHPKNDSGVRSMVGIVYSGNGQKQALRKLQELTGKQV
jgi:hypothetical protein